MTKINAQIKDDKLTPSGRQVAIKWTTDNTLINQALTLPRMWHATYPTIVSSEQIMTEFENDAVPLIKNAESHISNSMVGKSFEVEL